MARTSNLLRASKLFSRLFMDTGPKVYKYQDLQRIISEYREEWKLGKSTTTENCINFLVDKIPLNKIIFHFPARNETRYVFGECSIFSLVQSLKPDGYFSHRSAAEIHGLLCPNNQIYFNYEQSLRSQSTNEITQEAIDRAFQNNARTTKNKSIFNGYTIWLLNGKNSNCYGVIQIFNRNGEQLRVSNIARTLIDMTVRPIYSGGPMQVLEAYHKAKELVDGATISQTLMALKHNYPYHQSVGFYMEKAGFSKKQLEFLKIFPLINNFYIDYQMEDPNYSPTWKLYYPKYIDDSHY